MRVNGWLTVAAFIIQPRFLIRNVGTSDMKYEFPWLSRDYGVL